MVCKISSARYSTLLCGISAQPSGVDCCTGCHGNGGLYVLVALGCALFLEQLEGNLHLRNISICH